jgi:hypothetical protein
MAWPDDERAGGGSAPHCAEDAEAAAAEAGAAAEAHERAAAAAQLHEQHMRRRWFTMSCLAWLIILLMVRPLRACAPSARACWRVAQALAHKTLFSAQFGRVVVALRCRWRLARAVCTPRVRCCHAMHAARLPLPPRARTHARLQR